MKQYNKPVVVVNQLVIGMSQIMENSTDPCAEIQSSDPTFGNVARRLYI